MPTALLFTAWTKTKSFSYSHHQRTWRLGGLNGFFFILYVAVLFTVKRCKQSACVSSALPLWYSWCNLFISLSRLLMVSPASQIKDNGFYLWLAWTWSLIGCLLISWVIGSWCSLLLEKIGRVHSPRNTVVLWWNHSGAWGEHFDVKCTSCTTAHGSTFLFL